MIRLSTRRALSYVLLFVCVVRVSPSFGDPNGVDLLAGATAAAQPRVPIAGVVVDEAGSVVAGALVTLITSSGAIAQRLTTDGAGEFVMRGLEPGTYSLLVELQRFSPLTEPITVPASGLSGRLRLVLKAGGFAETVVVTARRSATRLSEIPQTVEVVDGTDIERSVAADVADVLKKN